MDAEQLKKANDLTDQIEKTENTLNKWKNAKSLGNSAIYTQPGSIWADASPMSFEVLKALNIAHYSTLLEEQKAELEKM